LYLILYEPGGVTKPGVGKILKKLYLNTKYSQSIQIRNTLNKIKMYLNTFVHTIRILNTYCISNSAHSWLRHNARDAFRFTHNVHDASFILVVQYVNKDE